MVGGPSVHQIAGGVTRGERSCSRVGTRGATVVTRQEPGNSDVKPTRRKIGAFLPCEDTHGRTMYVYSIDRSCVFFVIFSFPPLLGRAERINQHSTVVSKSEVNHSTILTYLYIKNSIVDGLKLLFLCMSPCVLNE